LREARRRWRQQLARLDGQRPGLGFRRLGCPGEPKPVVGSGDPECAAGDKQEGCAGFACQRRPGRGKGKTRSRWPQRPGSLQARTKGCREVGGRRSSR